LCWIFFAGSDQKSVSIEVGAFNLELYSTLREMYGM